MLAVVQDSYGLSGSLQVVQVPRPAPGPGQVLVRVRAAGVSRGTLHLVTGLPRIMRLATGLRRPRPRGLWSAAGSPGLDVCGSVVALGPGVSRFAPGQEVFGIAKGSFAQYAVADADTLALVPTTLSAPQAAVLAESGQTALQALAAAAVEEGTRVLVIGASGGVGSFAVKLAAASGAEVTAVCRGAKAAAVAGWGAARVLDYTTQDPTTEDVRYDAILDIGGGTPLSRLRRVLTPSGTIVFVGNETGQAWTGGFGRPLRNLARMVLSRQRFVMLTERDSADDLDRLARLASDGQLVPHVHATFPLARTQDALTELACGTVCGKIALVTAETQPSTPSTT